MATTKLSISNPPPVASDGHAIRSCGHAAQAQYWLAGPTKPAGFDGFWPCQWWVCCWCVPGLDGVELVEWGELTKGEGDGN